MKYLVRRAIQTPVLNAHWDDPANQAAWSNAQILHVDQFHVKSSSHRPITRARVLHGVGESGDARLFVQFDVQDQFVRCTHTEYQSRVSRDSCVEFFLRPRTERGAEKGYFNFEINCGGTMLLYYIEDPTRVPDRLFNKFVEVPIELGKQVAITTMLPRRVDPELTEPTRWGIGCEVPVSLFEHYVGKLGSLGGTIWSGNFFKCAEEVSRPHWASWSSIGDVLRFHQPEFFAPIEFA